MCVQFYSFILAYCTKLRLSTFSNKRFIIIITWMLKHAVSRLKSSNIRGDVHWYGCPTKGKYWGDVFPWPMDQCHCNPLRVFLQFSQHSLRISMQNFMDIFSHLYTHTVNVLSGYQHIISFQRFKAISITVTPPSDFDVLKNVHANAQQFTPFKLK